MLKTLCYKNQGIHPSYIFMKHQFHVGTKADLSFNLRHFWPMKSFRRPRLQRKTDSHFKISDAVHNMLGTYFHCIFSSKDKISNSCRLWFWKWSWTVICFIARISGCSLAAPIVTPISIGINSNTSGFQDNWVYAKKPRRNKIVCLNSRSWAPCILNPDQEETFPKNRKLYNKVFKLISRHSYFYKHVYKLNAKKYQPSAYHREIW